MMQDERNPPGIPGALERAAAELLVGTATNCARGAVAMACILLAAVPAAARTFSDILGTATLKPVGQALGDSIGRSLPVISASPGVVYTFDPEAGAFEREAALLGQVFLERPETLGRKKWNLSLNYQRVKFDTLGGDDIEALSDTRLPIIERRAAGEGFFTIPRFAIDLETHELTASVTYGVTDDLDLNLTLPLLHSEFHLDVAFLDTLTGRPLADAPSSSKTGVGDLFLRTKYRLLRHEWAQAAAGIVLRVPSGNEDNFQGTGDVELSPRLYASARAWPVGGGLVLRPYINGGVNFNATDVDRSEALWGLGLDARVGERFTGAVAVLGRHPFQRLARPGFFDRTRCARIDPETATCSQRVVAPLLGIADRRPDFYDLSVGVRVNMWRDMFFAYGNAIVPLNDDGFRSDVIPLAGIETTF